MDVNYLPLDIFLAACGIVIIIKYWHSNNKARSFPLPPGPKPLPIIGNLLDFPERRPWETFGEWGKRYGDVVHMRSLGQSYIILNSFKVVNDLLEKRSLIYSGRPHYTMISDIMDMARSTTLMPYGSVWKRHRAMFHQQLNPTAIQQYQPRQVTAARGLLRSILETPQDFELHIRHMATEIVMSITYGHTISVKDDLFVSLAEQIPANFARALIPGEFLADLIPILKYVPEWFPGAGFQKFGREARDVWHKSLDMPFEDVKTRLAAGTAPPSIVANALAELDVSNDYLEDDWEEVLKAVSGSIYGAGADTTLAAVHSFVLAMLLYPDVQKTAQAELDSVVGHDRLPDFTDRTHLPYMEALVEEVLRWHPVIPTGIPHTIAEDDIYNGYRIPKGAILIPNAWGILHDPEMYPDPLEFRPERFLSNDNDVRDPTTAGTFGYGRRICPGRHLADASIWIATASLLAAFHITPAVDEQGRNIEVRYALDPLPGILVHPSSFPCMFKPRYVGIEELLVL